MKDLLEQIQKGLDANLYYLSLFVALAIPDICGALESEDGKATSRKYKKWFNEYMVRKRPDKYGERLTSDDIYNFRCSLLHQGSSHHSQGNYLRILFIEPGFCTYNIHSCVVGAKTNAKSLLIDIRQFCDDIVIGVNSWIEDNKKRANYKKNYNKLIKRYPKGITPVLGCPIIA